MSSIPSLILSVLLYYQAVFRALKDLPPMTVFKNILKCSEVIVYDIARAKHIFIILMPFVLLTLK